MLDAVVLLAEACGISKEKLLASYPDNLEEKALETYDAFISKRIEGYPVSYIRCRKEFFGLDFYVDERVLVPRPDTEILVEETLAVIRDSPGVRQVHDVCTGSGCIAIALKHAQPELYITASDVSSGALEVFALNARKILRNELTCYKSDLLVDVPGSFDIIVANPPYLTDRKVEEMKSGNWPEPEIALRGGEDGLDLVKRIIDDSCTRLNQGGWLLLEGGPDQLEDVKKIMEKSGYLDILIRQDLAGRDRVIRGKRNR
jgi:release factor glutamine methyltransferase